MRDQFLESNFLTDYEGDPIFDVLEAGVKSWVNFDALSFTKAGSPVFVDISENTNLAVAARLALTGDTLDLASSVVTPGTYPVVTVDTYGRATAGRALTDADVPNDLTIVAGTINNTPIGAVTPSTIAATTLLVTSTSEFNDNIDLIKDGDPIIRITGYNDATGHGRLHTRGAGGTEASPTIIAAGQHIGRWATFGWDGAAWVRSISQSAVVTGTPASGDIKASWIWTRNPVDPDITLMELDWDGNLELLGALVMTETSTAAAYLALAGGTMTGAITLHADPSSAMHAATKQYVDNLAAGFDVKPSVKGASTANLTLSGEQTIDGISAAVGDRWLVKNQSAPAENGIYVVSAGAWTRATDMDSWTEVPGAMVLVEQGSTLADSGWVSTANTGGTLDTTAITWSQFFGTGLFQAANANLTAIAGLSTAADKMSYWTGASSAATTDFTAFARAFVALTTLTSNGVLYGNGSGAVQATSQGAANSVLTANAGAPVFSADPRINSLGIGQAATGTAGQIQASSTSAPIALTRSGTATNSITSCGTIQHTTSNDMSDGFGISLIGRIRDSAAVNNDIGDIAFVRAGADNTGAIHLRPYTTGTAAVALTLTNIAATFAVPVVFRTLAGTTSQSMRAAEIAFNGADWYGAPTTGTIDPKRFLTTSDIPALVGASQNLDVSTSESTTTTVEPTKTTLYTYTIAASKLAANGDRIEAVFNVDIDGAGGEGGQFYIEYGGSQIFALEAGATTASGNFQVRVTIVRTGSSAQKCIATWRGPTYSGAPAEVTFTDTSLALGSTQTLVLKGNITFLDGTNNQVTFKSATVNYHRFA